MAERPLALLKVCLVQRLGISAYRITIDVERDEVLCPVCRKDVPVALRHALAEAALRVVLVAEGRNPM